MASRADIVRRLYDLTCAGAVEEVLAFYHDDAVVEVAFDPPAVEGKEAIRGYLADMAARPDVGAEVSSLRFEESGDAVLVTGRVRLRDDVRHSLVDSPAAWVFHFRGEKIAAVRAFRDVAAARATLPE
jgi:ketosteroid isomerase-like protein